MNRSFLRFLTGSASLLLSTAGLRAAVYDWSVVGGGSWTTAENWLTNPGGATGVPVAGDTANLNDTEVDRLIIYPTTGTATVGTINFNQSSAFTNSLEIQRTMTVTNAITLGASSGTEELRIVPTVAGGSGGTSVVLTVPSVTIQTGGRLFLGIGPASIPQNTTDNSALGNLTGNVIMSGGEFVIANSLPPTGAAQHSLSGTFTATGGSLAIGATNAIGGTAEARLTVGGNFNATNTSVTGSASAQLILNGTSSIIGTGATFGSTVQLVLNRGGSTAGAADQTLSSTVPIQGLFLRQAGSVDSVKTVTISAPGENLGAITMAGVGGRTTTFKLGSDLTTKNSTSTNSSAPQMSGVSQSGILTFAIDSAGFTLDVSKSIVGWTPNYQAAGAVTSVNWNLLNSGTVGSGGMKAQSFTFTAANTVVSVGAGLVLEANGGNTTASNLGNAATSTATIDATSTFRYTGAAAVATPATLASNRAVGKVEVGNASTASALRLAGSITAAGTVSVRNLSSLDLSTQTLTAAAGLDVAGGTLRGGTTTTAGIVDGEVVSTGTLAPGTIPITTGVTIGTLGISSGLQMNSGSAFALEIESAASFDKVQAGAISLNGNVALSLTLATGFTPTLGSTFTILENTGLAATSGSLSWNGTTLGEGAYFETAGNGFTISYAGGSGSNDVILTAAVPEPGTCVALLGGFAVLAGLRPRTRSAKR